MLEKLEVYVSKIKKLFDQNNNVLNIKNNTPIQNLIIDNDWINNPNNPKSKIVSFKLGGQISVQYSNNGVFNIPIAIIRTPY